MGKLYQLFVRLRSHRLTGTQQFQIEYLDFSLYVFVCNKCSTLMFFSLTKFKEENFEVKLCAITILMYL
jgi:hypothetical protein